MKNALTGRGGTPWSVNHPPFHGHFPPFSSYNEIDMYQADFLVGSFCPKPYKGVLFHSRVYILRRSVSCFFLGSEPIPCSCCVFRAGLFTRGYQIGVCSLFKSLATIGLSDQVCSTYYIPDTQLVLWMDLAPTKNNMAQCFGSCDHATIGQTFFTALYLGLIGLLGLGSQGRRPVMSALPESLPCSWLCSFSRTPFIFSTTCI